MLKRCNLIKISEEDQEDLDLANWVWNSHSWIETSPGYYECIWCGRKHTSTMPVSKDYPICKRNPIIEKILSWN